MVKFELEKKTLRKLKENNFTVGEILSYLIELGIDKKLRGKGANYCQNCERRLPLATHPRQRSKDNEDMCQCEENQMNFK